MTKQSIKAGAKNTHVAWMVDYFGFRFDAREMPLQFQREVVKKKLIKKLPSKDGEELDGLFLDAVEWVHALEVTRATKLLEKMVAQYDFYIPAFGLLAQLYRDLGNYDRARELNLLAYKTTLQKYPTWPENMEWGNPEYRPYLRTICDRAALYQVDGDLEQAIPLYELLLKLTPGDNQGIRYLLAGLYAGVSPAEVDKMTDDGNSLQDWSALENMLADQNAKHKFWQEPVYD